MKMMLRLTRRSAWRLLALAAMPALALLGAQAHAADNYPDRPIKLIVAYPPGGGTDILARQVGTELGKELGQPVVIVNRPGASGTIGTTMAARAEPDGYTLVLATSSTIIMPMLNRQIPFNVERDFSPVTLLTESPFLMVVPAKAGIRSLRELNGYSARHRGAVNYASTGVGSTQHLATEYFKAREGGDWLHVPYQGGGPMLNAILEGQVHVMFTNVLPVLPFIRSGRLVPLLLAATERLPALPDVPTAAEAGVDDFAVGFWSGVLAPKGTPQVVIDKLDAALLKVMRNRKISDELVQQGAVVKPLGSRDFARHIARDRAMWERTIKSAQIGLEKDGGAKDRPAAGTVLR